MCVFFNTYIWISQEIYNFTVKDKTVCVSYNIKSVNKKINKWQQNLSQFEKDLNIRT